jgi:hypothetical protein
MEQYYLVPKELMDKVMSDLGSYAYLTHSFNELMPLNESLTNCPLIDLSDEAIEKKAAEYVNDFYDVADMKSFDKYLAVRHYKKALTYLKTTL